MWHLIYTLHMFLQLFGWSATLFLLGLWYFMSLSHITSPGDYYSFDVGAVENYWSKTKSLKCNLICSLLNDLPIAQNRSLLPILLNLWQFLTVLLYWGLSPLSPSFRYHSLTFFFASDSSLLPGFPSFSYTLNADIPQGMILDHLLAILLLIHFHGSKCHLCENVFISVLHYCPQEIRISFTLQWWL